MRTEEGGSARGTFGVARLGLGQTNRATNRTHGPTTADPILANGTDTQGVVRTDVTRSEWMRCALRLAGD